MEIYDSSRTWNNVTALASLLPRRGQVVALSVVGMKRSLFFSTVEITRPIDGTSKGIMNTQIKALRLTRLSVAIPKYDSTFDTNPGRQKDGEILHVSEK